MPDGTVEWRAVKQPSGETDDDLFDVVPLDTLNRFARKATAWFENDAGGKKDEYPYGQRVDLEVKEGDGSFSRWWSGFAVQAEDREQNGDIAEVTFYSYDHFLKKGKVFKTYTNEAVSDILKDVIETFTSITWDSNQIDLANDATIDKREFKGERPDAAIKEVLDESAGEEFGVDDTFTFFARERETTAAPSGSAITDSDWFDYDFPDDARQELNEVELFYGEGDGTGRVVVEDRASKKELQDELDADRPVVVSDSFTYPEIDSEDRAFAKARSLLGGNSVIQTGTVTSRGRFDVSPGDVLPVTIETEGVDDDFRVAGIEHRWRHDEAVFTVVEERGAEDELLLSLFDDLGRVESRQADPDATIVRWFELRSGGTVTATGSITTRVYGDGRFNPGFGRDELGFGRGEPGFHVTDVRQAEEETAAVVNAGLNSIRDGWQGDSPPQISRVLVGDGTEAVSRTDTALNNQLDTADATINLVGDTTVRFEATIEFDSETDTTEIGIDDGSALHARVVTGGITAPARSEVDLVLEVDVSDDPDREGVLTDTGAGVVRDILADNSPDTPTEIAFGTDATDPSTSDTALGNEVKSKSIDEFNDKGTGETDVITTLETGDANGNDLEELGQTNSADELLTRVVFAAISKTSDLKLVTNQRMAYSNA